MADRTVSVKLLADVKGFVSGIQRASAESARMSGTLAQHAAKNEQAYTRVGQTLLGIGLAAGAGVAVAITTFARFDQQMSLVAAASGEAGESLDALRQAAIRAGADTAFSATEAAQGVTELSKAGVSASDILGGALAGSLDLAAAGGLGVGEAAEIAATAMTQFGLEGSEVTHVADLLAAGAGKAQGDVTDLGSALKQSGLVASQTGLSIEETTGALGAFASAGLLGSDAGTSFKSMLQRLTPQSKEAKSLMDELGISAYDSAGQFIGLSEFAGNLQSSLADLTPEQRNSALATIFGSDAVRAASIIYQEGAAGVEEWISKVDDSGYASEQAAAKLDNLLGDLEAFGGSVETALIGMGEAGNGPLRELVQNATTLVNVFNDLPGPVQQGALAVGGVTAAVGLAGGSILILLPRVVAFNAALATMGPLGVAAASGLRAVGAAAGPIGLALTAVTVIGGVLLNGWINQKQAVDEYAASLDAATGAVTDNTRVIAAKTLQDDGAYKAANNLGISLETVTEAALGNSAAMAEVAERVEAVRSQADSYRDSNGLLVANTEAQTSARALTGDINVLEKQLGTQNTTITEAQAAARELAEGLGETGVATTDAAAATGVLQGQVAEMAAEVDSAEDAITSLDAALKALFAVELGVQEATDAVEDAIYDMAEASRQATEDGKALTGGVVGNTQASRDNRAAVNDAMRAVGEEAVARVRNGESVAAVTARVYASREALIAEAVSRGASRAEAEEYTSVLLDIPDQVSTVVSTPGMQVAIDAADYLRRSLDAIPKSVSVSTTTYATTVRQDIAMASRAPKADGGMVFAANGLTRESMIVRGGAYGPGITWAEPETGWEAYISGKPGKRARNVGILADAAGRFGLTVVDPSTRGRGSTTPNYGPAGAGTAAAARETSITVNADSAVLRTYGADIARQVIRERDLIAATSMAAL